MRGGSSPPHTQGQTGRWSDVGLGVGGPYLPQPSMRAERSPPCWRWENGRSRDVSPVPRLRQEQDENLGQPDSRRAVTSAPRPEPCPIPPGAQSPTPTSRPPLTLRSPAVSAGPAGHQHGREPGVRGGAGVVPDRHLQPVPVGLARRALCAGAGGRAQLPAGGGERAH